MDETQETLEGLRRSSRARRNLRPVVVGQAISLFGDYIAYFTLPWLVVTLTGRPQDLGLTAAFETLPLLLFGFAAGVLLDRADIRRVLVYTDMLRALVFVFLAIAVAGDFIRPEIVFAAAFVLGSMSVLFESGLNALLPIVVGEDLLLTTNTRLSVARNLALSLGPAVGGLLVVSGGFAPAFMLDALTFLVSAAFLMQVRELRRPERYRAPGFVDAMAQGIRFVARQVHLRWATFGAAVVNLVFAPLEALLVLFVRDRLAGQLQLPGVLDDWFQGAAEVGLFIAVQAAIGAIGVLVAPRAVRVFGLGPTYLLGLLMFGGGFLVVSFSSDFLAVIPAGFALAGLGWTNVAFTTMRQELTPDRLLGRVMASTRTLSWLLIPLGASMGGFIAAEVGLRPVYVAGSLMVLATALILALGPLGHTPIVTPATGPGVDPASHPGPEGGNDG